MYRVGAVMKRRADAITRNDIDRMNARNRYNAQASYVPALRKPQTVDIGQNYQIGHTIDAPLSSTQHVEMRTSAVDRSKGFLLASVPLYAAFALGVVLMGVLFTGYPFWSFWSFAIFWLSFVLAWAWGYWQTLEKSAEGVAHYEARQKWGVIKDEHRRRWDHYERLMEERE